MPQAYNVATDTENDLKQNKLNMSYQRHTHTPLRKLNARLKALAKWFIHSPHYQLPVKTRHQSEYDDLAKVYPYCPPEVEQRAWLERQYQESPETKE